MSHDKRRFGFRITVFAAAAAPLSVLSTGAGAAAQKFATIRARELDFGMVQSDVQYGAHKGEGNFEKAGPCKDLRAVSRSHPEPFTVVALEEIDAKSFADLEGKRVNVGNPRSARGPPPARCAELGVTHARRSPLCHGNSRDGGLGAIMPVVERWRI